MTGSFCKPKEAEELSLAVLELFVPGHLDGFELGFVGGGRVAGEAGEFGDPFVHVGEADGERVGFWEFVGQADGDIFEIVPTECRRHVHSKKRFNTESSEIAESTEITCGLDPPLQWNQ